MRPEDRNDMDPTLLAKCLLVLSFCLAVIVSPFVAAWTAARDAWRNRE